MLLIALALAALPPTAATADTAPRSRTATVNGIEMRYVDRGSGPPLVMLHGFLSCGDGWGRHTDRFAERYRVIVPDLRAHGGTTNPGGTFTMRQSAVDVFALLDHLGVKTFKALGISAGGMTLLHMATRQPERVEAMVLVGATTYFPEQARKIMRGFDLSHLPPDFAEEVRRCHLRGEPQLRELAGLFRGFEDSYDDMSFTDPHLGTIRARTLIVHGDRDEFFPVDIAAQMYRAIPRSALWIVPGGDHVPIYGRRAAAFQDEALAFLEAAAARP